MCRKRPWCLVSHRMQTPFSLVKGICATPPFNADLEPSDHFLALETVALHRLFSHPNPKVPCKSRSEARGQCKNVNIWRAEMKMSSNLPSCHCMFHKTNTKPSLFVQDWAFRGCSLLDLLVVQRFTYGMFCTDTPQLPVSLFADSHIQNKHKPMTNIQYILSEDLGSANNHILIDFFFLFYTVFFVGSEFIYCF